MISKLSLVALALTAICIYAKPSNPEASFDQVSFHLREAGKLWWRALHSAGLALDLKFKIDRKSASLYIGYLGFEYCVTKRFLLLLFYFIYHLIR